MSEILSKNSAIPSKVVGLRVLEGKELASWKLAPGDIYYQTPATEKLLLLKRCGDLLEESWVTKMRNNSGLRFRDLVHLKRVAEISSQWEQWKTIEDPAEFEKAGLRLCDVIRGGLHSEGGITLLDWAFVCHQQFKPDEELQLNMLAKHEVLHRRGLYVSALSVLFAIACGYSDSKFLQELYQTAWLLDSGLLHDDFSYWIAVACQAEKQRPGSGLEFLKHKKASHSEIELFLQHPVLGHSMAMQRFEKKFQNPGLLNIILHHHELADGRGFPHGIPMAAMSDWESILVMADQMIDYREEVIKGYAEQGLRECWQVLRRLPLRNLPIQRVLSKIAHWSQRDNLAEVSA